MSNDSSCIYSAGGCWFKPKKQKSKYVKKKIVAQVNLMRTIECFTNLLDLYSSEKGAQRKLLENEGQFIIKIIFCLLRSKWTRSFSSAVSS